MTFTGIENINKFDEKQLSRLRIQEIHGNTDPRLVRAVIISGIARGTNNLFFRLSITLSFSSLTPSHFLSVSSLGMCLLVNSAN